MKTYNDWEIYPNYFLQNLGMHSNACMAPIIGFDFLDPFNPEVIVDENDPWPIYTDIRITGYLSFDVTIKLWPTGTEFNTAGLQQASEGTDFWFPAIDYTIPAGGSGIETIEVTSGIIDNYILDGDKHAAYDIFILNGNRTGVTVGYSNGSNIWDMLIIDDEEPLSISEQKIDNSISLYPTIANNEITIDITDPSVMIESVYFYSADGKLNQIEDVNKNKKINIDCLTSSGYYMVVINTNKGSVKKRFIKK